MGNWTVPVRKGTRVERAMPARRRTRCVVRPIIVVLVGRGLAGSLCMCPVDGRDRPGCPLPLAVSRLQDPNAHLVNAAKIGQAQVALATQFTLPGAAAVPGLAGAAAGVPGLAGAAAGVPGLAGLMVTTPTAIVLLENMVTCGTIRDDTERKEVR